MKIIQINAYNKIKSIGRTSFELSGWLQDNGHVSIIAHADYNLTAESFLIGNRWDWKLHAFLSRLTGKQAYFSKQATRKLLRMLEVEKPDVVHLRNLHANFIHLPLLLKFLKDKDIPVVITLHDCWIFTGKCCYYTIANCNRWKTGCGHCPQLKADNPSWRFDRTAEMWTDKRELLSAIPRLAVVGVSDWITNEAKQSPFFQKAIAIQRIYNWIDLSLFKPQNTPLRQELPLADKFVILGVATGWSARKGLNDWLELAQRLDDRFHIILLGAMPKNVVLPGNVISIPASNNIDQLIGLYNTADCFITFSREETFGKVSAEAIACGTPVICYRSTANPELVGEGCGFVAETGDLNGVTNAIHTIHRQGKAHYTPQCWAFAQKNFDKETNIQQYMELYNLICSK